LLVSACCIVVDFKYYYIPIVETHNSRKASEINRSLVRAFMWKLI